MIRKVATLFFAAILAATGLEMGASLLATGELGIGRPAEARIGRPLTPVSVAGVGRRTVRRCAVGIYYC